MGDNEKPVLTRPAAGGVDIPRPKEDVAEVEGLGEAPVSTEGLAARAAKAAADRRRESFDTLGDKALTLAEGVVDALSVGFLHIPGEAADIRRDVNSGSAMVGQMIGFVAGMEAGPVKWLSDLGKGAGRTAAKAVLGEVKAGSRAAIGVRTAEGAGELATVMGATSIGHQVTDVLLDDKDFSASAVIHEAGLGTMLGGGFSFLSGVFGKAAKRYEIKGQGGIMDPASEASKGLSDHVHSAVKAWDEAIDVHAQRLGVLKQLEAEGLLDHTVPQFIADREVALAKARGAQSVLRGMDFEAAMAGKPKAMRSWVRAMEDYEASLGQLDDVMRARNLERVRPGELGKVEAVPGAMEPGKSPTRVFQEKGGVDRAAYELDDLMRDPRRMAEYEKLHGRPYEPMPPLEGELPKGVETATSALETKAGTPRRPAGAQRINPSPEWQVVPEGAIAPPGGEYRMNFQGATEARWPTAKPPEGPWQPLAEPGKFSVSEFSPNTLAGEGMAGRAIEGVAPVNERLSNAYGALAKDQVMLPDGYFLPAADARQNALAFENFRQRMAGESVVAPQAAPRPVEASTKVIGRKAESSAAEAVAEPAARAPKAEVMTEGQRAVRRYIDEWYAASDAMGPKLSPGDAAADHIRRVLQEIQGITGGREIAAGDAAKALRLEARTSLGGTLNDIYAMRQLADVGADASKTTVMRGQRGNRFLNWATRRAAGKMGAAMLGGAIGSKLGGPVGYFAGAALAYKYVGFGARAAGAAGRLYEKSVKAADGLLKGKRATYAARAAAGNRPVAYSDRGPIKNPVERIEDLQRVASSPATMADLVARMSGDLNLVAPEFVQSTVTQVQAQLGFLLRMAPPLTYDRLGRPIQPSAGAIRAFLEAENAVFDLAGVLKAVEQGRVTKVQVEALRNAHLPVYTRIAAFLLDDPEKLQRLERAKLRTISMVTGLPLTPADDPMAVMQGQMVWEMARQAAPQAGPTQALKIGNGKPPSETPASQPTPSQSYGQSGRAPGN